MVLADLSDIESLIAATIISVIYPQGIGQPPAIGIQTRVYRGEPLTGPLQRDLSSGVSNVSVFAVPSTARNTTRWMAAPHSVAGAATLNVSVAGRSATFTGACGLGQVAGLLIDGKPYVYRCGGSDTLVLVAATLAKDIAVQRACWANGPTIGVPNATRVVGRVVADGSTMTEWGRQTQEFRVSVWCPTPTSRDELCTLVGSRLACRAFLTLPDGTSARVRYRGTSTIDELQNAQQYRRDLIFNVEYGTTTVEASASMLFGDTYLDGAAVFG